MDSSDGFDLGAVNLEVNARQRNDVIGGYEAISCTGNIIVWRGEEVI